MNEPFKFGSCSLFLTPIWIKLPSDPDVSLQIKPLTYGQISSNQEVVYFQMQNDDFFNVITYHTILKDSIMNTRNALGFPNPQDILTHLSPSDLKFLYERLMEISTISRTQQDDLGAMLDVQFNSQFQNDSWDCTICQKKKLDYARGCGFLDEDKRDPKPMLPRVNGRSFSVCPISTIDGYVTRQASMSYSMLDAGVLPEPGGLSGQTEWFVNAALLYKRKIAEAERAAMDEVKNKR